MFLHTPLYFSAACLALNIAMFPFICSLCVVVFWWIECVLYPDCECVLSGPSHVLTQQHSTSMSLHASSHGTGPGYSHSAHTSQGQVAYSSMASRANLNMQSSQGEPGMELTWKSHPEINVIKREWGMRDLRKALFRNNLSWMLCISIY